MPLTDYLDAILIASDSQYEGRKPEKDDLIESRIRTLCFYGNRSSGRRQGPEEDEEKGFDSNGSTSFENTPSPPPTQLVERPISGLSSKFFPTTPATPSGPESVPKIAEPLEPAIPTAIGPSSSLHHLHEERPTVGGGPTNSGILPETATEPPGPSFTAPQPTTTLPASGLSLDPELGYGQLPPLASSSVLPAELMVYNDLMMDIGTAQYLGTGVQDLGSPQFAYPTVSANGNGGDFGSSSNWYQLESVSQPVIQLPSMMRSAGYPPPDSQYRGMNQSFPGQTGTGFGGQWSPGGIRDYE